MTDFRGYPERRVHLTVEREWTEADDSDGRDADACQILSRLECDAEEAKARLAEIRKQIREQSKRRLEGV